MGELTYLSAVSMAEQIRRGELSPVELLEAHLARIDELNPRLNAFVQVDVEPARREARLAEAAVRNREKLGPLHGVPLSIKSSSRDCPGSLVRSCGPGPSPSETHRW